MGVCTVEEEKNRPKYRKINKTEESKNYEDVNPKIKKKKSFHNKTVDISLISNKTIIKLIGEIKGKSIKIKNNIDCIILVMENSQSINVENCKNCSIFLAPCSTSILIDNCENLNLICASLNLKIINVKKGNFFIFSIKPVIIKDSEDIFLGNFFFQYTELPEMFINSKLNIWNNNWSCYEEEGKNENINYSNDLIKQQIIDKFNPILSKCYINIDQYQFFPFTFGKSINYSEKDENNNYINFIIIIRPEDIQESEILKMILPEELEKYNVKLISTLALEEKNNKVGDLIQKLELNKDTNNIVNYILGKNSRDELLDSKQSSVFMNSINKSRLNEIDLSNNEYMSNNFKFLKNKDLLILWFVNCTEDFNKISNYFNCFIESNKIDIIKKETFGWDDEEFKNYLNKVFEYNKCE